MLSRYLHPTRYKAQPSTELLGQDTLSRKPLSAMVGAMTIAGSSSAFMTRLKGDICSGKTMFPELGQKQQNEEKAK